MKRELNWGFISDYRNQIYGITLVWIIIFHIWESFNKYFPNNWLITDLIKRGNIGVDIFLFISGVSLFYSFKRNPNQSLKSFYKKRLSRIIKIYLIICVPYFIYLLYRTVITPLVFFKMLFFVNNRVNSFWFLLIISICYLFYPYLYKMIEDDKKHHIFYILMLYVVANILLAYIFPKFHSSFEILLTRIPIFIVGTIMGESVYNRREISSNLILFLLLIPFIYSPFQYIFKSFISLRPIYIIFLRYMLGVQALTSIFILIILIPYFEKSKWMMYLSKIGSYTLEIYIVHIIIRGVFNSISSISINNSFQLVLFSIVYIVSSIYLGILISDRISS